MQPLTKISSNVLPLFGDNIDTDQLMPKQFLSEISRTGFGDYLLYDERYIDGDSKKPNPDCSLNNPTYTGAEICVAGRNFGCGSSREHAPWGLAGYGIKIILAKSYADIFYANCLNNQILPIVLSSDLVDEIFVLCKEDKDFIVTVDLGEKTVRYGDKEIVFDIAEHHRKNLMMGVDKIGRTLQEDNLISEYERQLV